MQTSLRFLIVFALMPMVLLAQDKQPTNKASATVAAADSIPSAKPPVAKPAAPATPAPAALPPIDFSGIVFGNYQYHVEPGAGFATNKFDLERAYLTFKLPIADKVNLRATLDVSPQQSGTGYVIRQKYAYGQYDFGVVAKGVKVAARLGELQTAMIDQVEAFWPRWLGNVAVERAGFFSSADVGIAALATLPKGRGEVYAVISNGAGYSRPEGDRFKSVATRATFTPFSASKGFWKTAAFSVWGDKNAAASKFVNGGTGQVGPVGDGLRRDRFGAFAGVRDVRVTAGIEAAGRVDATEEGANTSASPRVVRDVRGGLYSAFTVVRPFQIANAKSTNPISIVARVDSYQPDARIHGRAQFVVTGVVFDVIPSRRTQVAVDYQAQTSDAVVTGIATTKVYAVRFVTTF